MLKHYMHMDLYFSSQLWQNNNFAQHLMMHYLTLLLPTMIGPEDKGIIKGWTAVRFENVDILTEGKVGMAMGIISSQLQKEMK